MITRELMIRGLIKGVQSGKVLDWRFDVAYIKKVAQRVMGEYFDTKLEPSRVFGVPKTFDLLSSYHRIVADAKYFTMVQGERFAAGRRSSR